MGVKEKFQQATFRGVPFLWRSVETSGGRKIVVHEYPNRNDRFVEDLGQFPRVFSVSGLITQGKGGENYFRDRDNLIAALEQEGPGELTHPTFGTAPVTPNLFSLHESQSTVGRADFQMEFLLHKNVANPVPADAAESEVNEKADDTINATLLDILQTFFVTLLLPENVLNAVNLLKGITGTMRDALTGVSTITSQFIGFPTAVALSFVSPAVRIQEEFGRFLSLADSFDNNQEQHLTDAQSLGDDTIALTQQFDLVPTDAVAGFIAAITLFDNAPGADDIAPVTFASVERKANNDLIRRTVRLMAYALASRNAAKVSFGNTNELDSVQNELERQFDLLQMEDLENTQVSNLSALRDTTTTLLQDVEVTTFRVVATDVRETSMLLLAFQQYGEDAIERSEDLLALNPDIRNPAFIPAGEVDILKK